MSEEGKRRVTEELTDVLSVTVPELREEIEAVRRWWAPEVPGQHMVYGDILSFFIAKLSHDRGPRQALAGDLRVH
jgi:hypothetical protein